MKKILLPTDFSDNAWNAIQYALKLFKNEKCTFYLLNNCYPVIYGVDFMEVSSAQSGLIDAVLSASKQKLEALHQKINEQFKNPNHTFSKISSVNTLVGEIEELHLGNVMDFVVMGTKGASGLKEVLLGSNTVRVINNVRCPVLAIPSDFDFEPPREILFPSDYEVSFNDKHIAPILEIVKANNSRINILNVLKGAELTSNQKLNQQKLREYFKNSAHLFHSDDKQQVTEAITNFQLKARVNLLVMINNKNSFLEKLFFKSTVNQMGYHLNVPFLVIPSVM